MKAIFLLITFCFSSGWLFSTKTVASVDYILYKGYLGCKTDTLQYSKYDSLVLFIADSLKYLESSEKYKNTREIWGRYIFDIDSCLNMYSIWIGTMFSYRHGDVFESVLFNSCDSSIYLFEGAPERFSNVLGRFLSDKLSDNDVYELFGLYINTLSEISRYLPLLSFSDFEDYYSSQIKLVADSSNMSESWAKEHWNYDKDIEVSKDLIRPVEIARIDNSIYLNIYSWGRKYGNLEFWSIEILQGSFEILERKELTRNVGPGKFEE